MDIKNQYIYKTLIKMSYITKPKYEFWFCKEYWDAFDAACLFNEIDPNHSQVIKVTLNEEKTIILGKNLLSIRNFDNSKLLSWYEILEIEKKKKKILHEARVIDGWKVSRYPLTLINRYLQKMGNIPKTMMELAIEDFSRLYQTRNDNSTNKWLWYNNWRSSANISPIFLQVMNDDNIHTKKQKLDQSKITQVIDETNVIKQNQEEEKKIKIILEESAEARRIRVRDRGYEIYKCFKEQHSGKKITKDIVAEQIMKEEEPLYKLIAAKNPLKKQPAFGTYLKELRKTH